MSFLKRLFVTFAVASLLLVPGHAAKPEGDADLLRVRETVWRAWFANDAKALEHLVPAETIVFSGGETAWKHQADVLNGAAQFQKDGGKLVRLEFPRTEVQHFGDVAIVWSQYVAETETKGKRSIDSGRISEIFVRRNGEWVNPGWHSDPPTP
jgi:hypothetical protein